MRLALGALLAGALPLPALAQVNADGRPVVTHGLSYMTGFGTKAYPVVSLLYGQIVLSMLVMTVIGGLVLVGALMRRHRPTAGMESVPLERAGSGLSFIYIGIGITFFILLGFVVWNYNVLAAIAGPQRPMPITVHVVAQRWWWEFTYEERGKYPRFVTADELHVPIGVPVKVVLNSADVIHSFWIPALTGKMDVVPGQNNTTWFEADRPGIYRGQCTEFCGQQHAHMAFIVTAEPMQDFNAWWLHQLAGPQLSAAGGHLTQAEEGQNVFMRNCAVCHAIRGTPAGGKVGPDLSHLMERKTLAAGTVPNTIGYLSGWISNPQHIKPGNYMPTLTLSASQLSLLRAYLLTLK